MALLAFAAGNVIVNVPLAVLVAPKSSTATAAFVVELYIKAQRAENVAGLQVTLLNVTIAVDPLNAGATLVNVRPPAVYPPPDTSLVVVYTVVSAPKSANASYKAILYVYAEPGSKSSNPFSKFSLNTLHSV